MNIRSIDLNLLVALKALLDEKHVSRAAERIGLSQPAMSRVLLKLRNIFKDPLLVRGGSGLDLTTRAHALRQPLQNILVDINRIITPPISDPAIMKEEISIATRDNEMVAILPQVINHIAREAPGISLRIISLLGDDLSALDRNEIDFIMTGSDSQSASLCRQLLYKESFVCLVSADNPVLKQKFSLESFVRMKHCLVTISGFGPGVVDKVLAEQRLKREITMRVPHFLAAAYIVAESDLVITLPRRIGLLLSKQKKVIMLEPPLKIPSFPIYLYWHLRNQNNPTHCWFRKVIKNLIAKDK